MEAPTNAKLIYPDWVGGMCMLFASDDYRQLNGFDEGFFLYYEDVDICVRARRASMLIIGCVDAHVQHDAQRASRRNWRHMRWHAYSMLRYFAKYLGRLPVVDTSRCG
jgi:GT2 family glycosyltransferase